MGTYSDDFTVDGQISMDDYLVSLEEDSKAREKAVKKEKKKQASAIEIGDVVALIYNDKQYSVIDKTDNVIKVSDKGGTFVVSLYDVIKAV